MEQKSDRFHPSAPPEKDIDLEQRSHKQLVDVNSFSISINNIKKVIPYFKDENIKSKKKQKKI